MLLCFSLVFACVHVIFASPSAVDLSNSTGAFEHVDPQINSINEVRAIKLYKDLDVNSSIIGLGAFLETCLQKKVLKYTLNPLTKLGENWGTVLQALEVNYLKSNDSNEVETLQMVCKFITTQSNQAIFDRKLAKFTKEMNFYSSIVPAIENFEEIINIPETERINAFPRVFGSRLSLDPNATKADANGLTLFEHLKYSNYFTPDRKMLLDRESILATLKTLAKLHALCIAIKRLQPTIYYSKIDPLLYKLPKSAFINTTVLESELRSIFSNYSVELYAKFDELFNLQNKSNRTVDTPFKTICHGDLWVTNVMIKNDSSDATIQVKILDFQAYTYDSFAIDLVYFLFMSARVDDLKTHFISFIEYYHSEFTKTLTHAEYPLDDYTYEKMWGEIKDKAILLFKKIMQYNKIPMGNIDGSTSKHGLELRQHLYDQPASEMTLIRWRCLIDLFIENRFI